MKLKIFTQPTCSNCPPAKALGQKLTKEQEKLVVEWWDTSTVEGMAEGAFYQVMATPTLILENDQGEMVKDWRGITPAEKEILKVLS